MEHVPLSGANAWNPKLVFHLFAALAEFERDLIRERTLAGLAAARARGRLGGRPKALDTKQAALARALYNAKEPTVKEICTLILDPQDFLG